MPATDFMRDLTDAAITFGCFLGVALLIRWTLHLLVAKMPWKNRGWFKSAFRPIRGFIVWTVVLAGLHTAAQTLDYVEQHARLSVWISRSLALVWVILAALVVVGIANAYFLLQSSHSVDPEARDRNVLLRKLTIGVILSIALLFAMRVAGLDVAPLLAGGAVGGVIIGLALQNSLSNVFAGLLLTLDGNIRVGEMVEFADGRTATVENIGWRSSTFRLLDSTVLVIPNNELSKDRFINLSRPTLVSTVSVECGVSYDTDLDRVERVASEIGLAVQQEVSPGADLEPPVIRWKKLAESSVNFRLFIQVADPKSQFVAESLLVKGIHDRFRQEKIDIPYATQTVVTTSEQ